MKKIGILLISSTLVLGGCGKRNEDGAGVAGYDANGQPTNTGTTGTPGAPGAAIGQEFTVRVVSSTPSLLTGGQDTAIITAAVTNENNLPVPDMDVIFSATAGVLQDADLKTDENGEASALLSLRYDSANQDILVKVVAGNYDGVARVVATGSTLEVTGEDNVVLGNDIEIEAKLTAGDTNPLANEIVTIVSKAGNTLSTSSGVTDPDGVVKVTVGSANGDDTLTFTALNDNSGAATVNSTYSFSVSDDQLKFADNSPTELTVNEKHSFVVNWSYNGTPIVGEDLKFTITAGQVVEGATATTNADGQAVVSVLSSIAGQVTLHAEAADGSVNNKHTFEFVGVTPDAIQVNSNSTRVNTRDSATIVAKVQDANGNPVKDTVVIFSSANLKGGQLSTTSATTNVDGEAEISFTAGSTATEENEIIIFSEVEGTAINNSVSLTVVKPVLNISVGSSNTIELIGNDTQYSVPFVVQVADGGGQALEGAQVRLSIEPVLYGKGQYLLLDIDGNRAVDLPDAATFSPKKWGPHETSVIACLSEDINGNRILDEGEDLNRNGSLDPQDPALLMPVPEALGLNTLEANGVLTTDATGSGYFNVVYPATSAGWAHVRIVARAQALGVEAQDEYATHLLTLNKAMADISGDPANIRSPYGFILDCADPN